MNKIEELNRKTLESKRANDEEYERVTSMQDGSFGEELDAVFYGGRLDGCHLNHKVLHHLKITGYTPRWSQMKFSNKNLINLSLEDQPIIEGYVGPILDGGVLRYETQEIYDELSN